MIKLFVLGLAAFASASCAMLQTMPNGDTKLVFAPQVGANVQVLDLCGGEPGILYGTDGWAIEGLRTLPGRHFWVALPVQHGLTTYSTSLTYVSMRGGRPNGSVSQSFPVDHNRGSQRFQWVLAKDGYWGGGGWGVYTSQCPR